MILGDGSKKSQYAHQPMHGTGMNNVWTWFLEKNGYIAHQSMHGFAKIYGVRLRQDEVTFYVQEGLRLEQLLR